jgi:hypothetical protein
MRGLFSREVGAFTHDARQALADTAALAGPIALLVHSADAIDPHAGGNCLISGPEADNMTLGAPHPGADDNLQIAVFSSTPYTHTLTAEGLLQTGSSGDSVLMFARFPGAGLVLRAWKGKWQLVSSNGITATS